LLRYVTHINFGINYINIFCIFCFVDTDNEISKRKLQNVTETEPKQIEESEEQEQNDEMEVESVGDEIEFIDKPERQDIEKKLE
jgi:hypothetical protein